MSELPPNIRKFLDEAKSAHDPSAAAPARVWSDLGGRLGVPLPPLPPVAPVAPSAPVSTLAQTASVGTKLATKTALAKLLSGALLVVAGGTAVGTFDRVVAHTDAPVATSAAAASVSTPVAPARAPISPVSPVSPVAAAEQATPLASSSPSASAPAPAPEDTPAPSPVSARPSAQPVTPRGSSLSSSAGGWDGLAGLNGTTADAGEAPGSAGPAALTTPNAGTLSGELTLLRDAEAALGRGDATQALADTDEHARLYPTGTLRQESMATRALALCVLKRPAEAKSLAVTLAGEAPRSPYADRLRASCAGWPTR